MIENLESRVLLTSTLVNGTLTLTSVVFGEHFVVNEAAGNVSVDILAEACTSITRPGASSGW